MSPSLYISHNPSFPRAAPAHLHGKPQTLCSSQGACSWDNPAEKRKKKTCGTMRKRGQEGVAAEPPIFWNRLQSRRLLTTLQPHPFKSLRLQGKQRR